MSLSSNCKILSVFSNSIALITVIVSGKYSMASSILFPKQDYPFLAFLFWNFIIIFYHNRAKASSDVVASFVNPPPHMPFPSMSNSHSQLFHKKCSKFSISLSVTYIVYVRILYYCIIHHLHHDFSSNLQREKMGLA